jgi:predicted O-methyltransferase YrrM
MRPELLNLPEPNWFWHGEQILDLVERHRPKVCVELGTNRGCSAIATARLLQQWGGVLICVDTWETENHGASVPMTACWQSVVDAGLNEVIVLNRSRIDEAARRWAGGGIDYLYVDADHTLEAVTSDLECWWPHLKVGGLIAGDDYDDPNDPAVPKNVTAAWDAFEAKHGQAFERVVTGVQGRLIWGIKR